MNNDASTDMTETTETVSDILDQIAAQMNNFPNVVEPAGGAGDVGVDVDAVYGLLPPSPSPSPVPAATVEEETDEEGAAPVEQDDDDQSEQPEKSDDYESEQPEQPVTPPRSVPAFIEAPPAVLRQRRRPVPEEDDSDSEPFVSLRTYSYPTVLAMEAAAAAAAAAGPSAEMTDVQRQVCRPITPVLGEVANPPCFMSDDEGELTDVEAEEEEAEAEEEETAEEQLMIKMPFWLFGLTCVAMTLYLTFVIYLLSWECHFPIRGH